MRPAKDWKERALLLLIKTISQECYGCEWNKGIEIRLWRKIESDVELASLENQVIADDLRKMSAEIGGWFVMGESGPMFVDFVEWQGLLAS